MAIRGFFFGPKILLNKAFSSALAIFLVHGILRRSLEIGVVFLHHLDLLELSLEASCRQLFILP